MDKLPSAQVIVLNWNGLALLDSCLSALSNLDYPMFNIVVVDNNSTDGSIDFVRRNFPHIKVIQNDKNLGYAGGNNQALRNQSADYAVLVNPDIVVTSDWLSELIIPMHADHSIGIAGGKLHYPDEQTIQHAGGFITEPQAMPVHQGMFERDTGQYEVMRDVDYVTGAVIAIRSPVLEQIGYLDEGFFMYFEEADWCARARAAGYRVVYIPQSTAVHDESAIAVKGSFSYLRRFHTGRWRYLLKHFDADVILSNTFAAETKWLLKLQSIECRALKRAYHAVHAGLDEILAARFIDGGSRVSDSQRTGIEANLIRLRKQTISQAIDQEKVDRLLTRSQIRDTPFRSQTPVIGALIAQLRSFWASIAAKEQAKAFTIQQSEFNQLLVEEIREMESRFETLELGLIEHDKNQVDIKGHQSEIRSELTYSYELLKSIKARLAQIDDLPRD